MHGTLSALKTLYISLRVAAPCVSVHNRFFCLAFAAMPVLVFSGMSFVFLYKQISERGFCKFWCRIFFFFWHWAVIRSMRHRGHRKPLTSGGLPSLGTGVFKKFLCFSECLFFCTSVLVCSALAATVCLCQPAPGPLGLTWEGRAADQCTAGILRRVLAHCRL